MTTKELQQEIISNMRRWQKIENAAAASTGQIMERTDNPVIHLLMEIIQRDSQMHYRVQEWIADTLQYKTVTLTPDELNQVWGMIEQHVEVEKKALEMANRSLDSLKGKKMVLPEYFLEYLAEDEKKHNELLGRLERIKKGMLP
ncbi:MAG TPA: hypothetical protein VEH09_00470 [Thermodesulfobacteriota bacterium]|nr:hypothetical protein [Thermodesulfobacteriota bacterium]